MRTACAAPQVTCEQRGEPAQAREPIVWEGRSPLLKPLQSGRSRCGPLRAKHRSAADPAGEPALWRWAFPGAWRALSRDRAARL